MKRLAAIAWLASVIACGISVGGDVVELRTGARIEGKLIFQDEERVVVDVGCGSPLTFARKDVLRLDVEKEQAPKTDMNDGSGVEDSRGLFSTAVLKPGTIKEKAEIFGPAVVLVSSPGGLGSGFFITERGHLVTNAHVIEGETKITVTVFQKGKDGFEKKKFEKVEILAVNPYFDLALLQVKADNTKFLKCFLGDSSELKNGDHVFAIGNPLGLERSVSQGIVSTVNRNMEGLVYIQTTAPINPGNSGGPMFNLKGEVIGVTSRKIMGFGIEGMGFAIPVSRLKEFLINRDAFAYDNDNPNSGYRYLPPPSKKGSASGVRE